MPGPRHGVQLLGRVGATPTLRHLRPSPWPCQTIAEQRERIADASRRIIARQQNICNANHFGLTTLYNAIDEGAYTDLRAMHRELDEEVAAAYGWPKTAAHDAHEIVQRLLILNQEIADGTRESTHSMPNQR
jgi:hypothetical protein